MCVTTRDHPPALRSQETIKRLLTFWQVAACLFESVTVSRFSSRRGQERLKCTGRREHFVYADRQPSTASLRPMPGRILTVSSRECLPHSGHPLFTRHSHLLSAAGGGAGLRRFAASGLAAGCLAARDFAARQLRLQASKQAASRLAARIAAGRFAARRLASGRGTCRLTSSRSTGLRRFATSRLTTSRGAAAVAQNAEQTGLSRGGAEQDGYGRQRQHRKIETTVHGRYSYRGTKRDTQECEREVLALILRSAIDDQNGYFLARPPR